MLIFCATGSSISAAASNSHQMLSRTKEAWWLNSFGDSVVTLLPTGNLVTHSTLISSFKGRDWKQNEENSNQPENVKIGVAYVFFVAIFYFLKPWNEFVI